jgi:DNA-binding transcriptional LysR family regulator
MNIWHLKTFCAVFEKRSFTKAASVVHRTQPSISAQIADLEKYYHTQLFIRKGKEVIPTERGDILYRYAQHILKLTEQSKEAIDEHGGMTRGLVTVGASTIPGTYILPELVSRFRQAYPAVKTSIPISDTRDVLQKLLEGELELGVVGEQTRDKRLEFQPLAEDRIVLVAPSHSDVMKKRSLSLDVLKREPLILREEGSGTRKTLQVALEKKGVRWKDLDIVAEFGNTEAAKNGVIAGLGLSFLSQWAIEREVKLGLISEIPVKGLDIQRHFFIVIHKGWPISRAAEVFLNFCSSKAVISLRERK